MKTLKQVLKENQDYSLLINEVIDRISINSVRDVNIYTGSAGFRGFTYYKDVHAFAMRHRKSINELLYQQAAELGEEVVSMVSHFKAFRNFPMDNEDRTELYKYLGGGKCEQSTITNLIAWFALEEVCRMFEN